MINKKVLLRKIKEKMREKFLNSDLWKKFGPRELKKTRREKEIIRLVQKKIDERFGRSSKLRRIYLKDVHVFSFADFQELVNEFGIYKLIHYQGICEAVTTYFWAPQTFIARFNTLSEFTHALIHDMIHAKSFWDVDFIYFSWESPLMKPAIKRSGLVIKKWGFSLNSLLKRPDLDSLDEDKIRELTKETVYFDSLNEAVIEELTKEIFNELVAKHPQLDTEAEPLRWAKQPKRIQQWHIWRRHLKPLEEIFLAKVVEIRIRKDGAWEEMRIIPSFFSYQKQRQRLYYLIRQIAEKKGIEYEEAKKQVMSVLTEALFAGRILPAARLIDGTLGKGTFRHIGKRGKLPNMVKPSNI